MLLDGWKSVGKVFVFAMVLDGVYQFIALRWFYPGEAFVAAVVLALIPYLLLRGPINHLARLKGKGANMHEKRDDRMPKKVRANPRHLP